MFDFQQGGMILKKYLPILKNSPFFTGLTDNEILSILHCVKATTVSQKRDSYIFRAGDSTEVMGLVVSGCVLVIQEDLWGHRNILSKCHTGDFSGEPYAASPGAVLNVSVVADTDCEIILLNVQRLLISCPTACEQAKTEPHISDYINIYSILHNITALKCDLYYNSLVPVVLANKLVSLADHPSSDLLKTFARDKIQPH